MMLMFLSQESEYPLVVIGIFIQQPTPFVTVFFERLLKLQYPKNRLKLFIYNQVTGILTFILMFLKASVSAVATSPGVHLIKH